jgi:integrase
MRKEGVNMAKDKSLPKGIYKRGEVYWIRYAGLDGKIVYESSKQGDKTGTKIKDAEALLHDRKADIGRGKQPEKARKIPNTTFKELATEYLKWSERQRGFQKKSFFIQQLRDKFDNVPLRHLNTMAIEQYQSERLNKGNKPATVNRVVAVLKHMIHKAVDWELVEESVLKKVRQAKQLEANNRRLRYLSKEECQTLINACDSHLKPIVLTALNTGCRKGEILGLTWENVDLKHGFILLDRTKNGKRREIPINATLRATLETLPRRLDGGHVFYDHKTGKPYQDVKKSFNSAVRRAKIKDFHFHDLRHTFASHLVMAGIDLTTVSRLLGHKDLTMTLRYSHLSPKHMSQAVDIMNEVLSENANYTKTIQSNIHQI